MNASFTVFKSYQTVVPPRQFHISDGLGLLFYDLCFLRTHTLLLTGASVSPRHGTVLKLFYHLSQPLPHLSPTVPLPPIKYFNEGWWD